jgi:large subunit ribosomal protein L22
MEYRAESKNIKMSPRKVRLVADAIRELKLEQALASLSVLEKRAADPIRKTLESAIANATNNFSASRGDLKIKEIMVGDGLRYKRYHYAARGRTRPYVRRSSHIRITLEDNIVRMPAETAPVEEAKPMKTEEKKMRGGAKS